MLPCMVSLICRVHIKEIILFHWMLFNWLLHRLNIFTLYSYSFVCTLFSAWQAVFICLTLLQWWHLAFFNLHFKGWWPGFPQHVHSGICCLLLPGFAPVNLNTSPKVAAEGLPSPWRVFTLCAADSIPSATCIAECRVRTSSENRQCWMCESFTPHTNWSRNITSRDVPKFQNSARALISDINVEVDSPYWQNLLKNLYHCMISDGFGLWWFVMASSKSIYDLSSNLSGATKVWSCLYAFGPMTMRRIALFLLASSMSLAVKKSSNRLKY